MQEVGDQMASALVVSMAGVTGLEPATSGLTGYDDACGLSGSPLIYLR
jgi:hypothetical protein